MYCEKLFTDAKGLKQHITYIHTIGKQFTCRYCEKLFSTAGTLRTHINNIHIKIVHYQLQNNLLVVYVY